MFYYYASRRMQIGSDKWVLIFLKPPEVGLPVVKPVQNWKMVILTPCKIVTTDNAILKLCTRGRTGKKGAAWHPPGGGWHRVKSIKGVTVMSKKVVSFSGENKYGWHCELTERQTWWPKKSSLFQEKTGVIPSVAAPDDTNPSDATDARCKKAKKNSTRPVLYLIGGQEVT